MTEWAKRIKAMGYAFANRPFIPDPLLESRRLILHISDTPTEIYPFLYRLIERLNPVEIIHTGDMADNYKIEFQDFHLLHYQESVSRFVKHIGKLSNAGIHIAMGNHDDLRTLKVLFPGEKFESRMVELYGKKFFLMHEFAETTSEQGYYCFGHKFEPSTEAGGPRVLLNGVLKMNVIDVDDWTVHHVEYPLGTNGYRKMTNGRMKL